jgi:hypothetical protein
MAEKENEKTEEAKKQKKRIRGSVKGDPTCSINIE